MYKIYVNERPLYFVDSDEGMKRLSSDPKVPVLQYIEKKSQLRKAKKWLEEKEFEEITFYHQDPKKILKHFCKIVKPYEAGGGLIRNPEGKYFFIFRRGHWDLPKGKLDPGEDFRQACVREVKEETNIDAVIRKDLGMTYHTYTFKDQPAIKITEWFLMVA